MDLDYKALGFRCGIEIHQQIDSHKLFCKCPSVSRDDAPDICVQRRMRAVAGEMGNMDPAALHEFLRDRTLVYEAYNDINCPVELDEEPPHPLNMEALDICLEVALLLGAEPVDEVHVMRKTVIDGSNTSGFQRTMMVAQDGLIKTEKGDVRVPSICLEEDAARIISEKDGLVRYRLDRLGIPLIELATEPDIVDAEHARECAQKIGSILRASKVKRGLGTIRQDINVSVSEGERVEIKGVQDLRLIKKLVETEVERQMGLIKAKKTLIHRKAIAKDYEVEKRDLSHCFRDTQSTVVKNGLREGGMVYGVKIKNFRGLLKGNLGPQLAQYARALAGVSGIFHGDELPAYGISPSEVELVEKELGINGLDSFALVTGDIATCDKALTAVLKRCVTAISGVPVEVRRAKPDASTEFMRPLPGSARMYPETDEPLIPIPKSRIEEISKTLPELREDKAKRYVEMGLSKELANQISKSGLDEMFEELATKFKGIDSTTVATTLTSTTKEAGKRFECDTSVLEKKHYEKLFSLFEKGSVAKNVFPRLLCGICEKPEGDIEEIAGDLGLLSLGQKELNTIIEGIIRDNPGLMMSQYIGKIMEKTGGRADPQTVSELISKRL